MTDERLVELYRTALRDGELEFADEARELAKEMGSKDAAQWLYAVDSLDSCEDLDAVALKAANISNNKLKLFFKLYLEWMRAVRSSLFSKSKSNLSCKIVTNFTDNLCSFKRELERMNG